jgi:hypothetical protein
MITLREYSRGDSIMPKKAKSIRSKTRAKTKTITKTKTTSTEKPKAKSKTEKKAKMEMTKLRLSKPLKIADKFSNDKLEQTTKQINVAEITKKPDERNTDLLPINNYRLEVDGRLKSEYPTAEAAHGAGLELKRKYPHIRIAVFSSKERTRTVVELPVQ